MASSRSGGGENGLREGLLMSGTLTGQKVNYLDSGYSEEDPSEQANVTSCLVKTSSGSIYIPPSNYSFYIIPWHYISKSTNNLCMKHVL